MLADLDPSQCLFAQQGMLWLLMCFFQEPIAAVLWLSDQLGHHIALRRVRDWSLVHRLVSPKTLQKSRSVIMNRIWYLKIKFYLEVEICNVLPPSVCVKCNISAIPWNTFSMCNLLRTILKVVCRVTRLLFVAVLSVTGTVTIPTNCSLSIPYLWESTASN